MPRTTNFLIISVFAVSFAFILSPLAFAQSSGIKGKVRTYSGNGIPNATVTVRQAGKDVRTVRSDKKGNFLMQGLEAGKYNVVFDADGYSSGVLYNVEIKEKSTRDLGERLILTVDPGSQVIVRGSVFFKEGTSVPGAKVEIERIYADGSKKSLPTLFTNESGEFAFRQPERDAKFRITAKYKDSSVTKELEVATAAVYRLAITLDISKPDR